MNKTKYVGTTLTDDEYKKLTSALLRKSLESGKKYSIAEFLRELITPILNGNSPKKLSQDTNPETKLPTKDVNPQKISADVKMNFDELDI